MADVDRGGGDPPGDLPHGVCQDTQSVRLKFIQKLNLLNLFSSSFPINFILLAIFTAAESVTLGMVRMMNHRSVCIILLLTQVSMMYDVDAVLIAAGITTAIVFVLTIFAFQVSINFYNDKTSHFYYLQTKWDFTMLRGILVCVLFVFLIFGIIMIFVPQNKYDFLSIMTMLSMIVDRYMQMVYGGLGALIFSVYLVYDTQVSISIECKRRNNIQIPI